MSRSQICSLSVERCAIHWPGCGLCQDPLLVVLARRTNRKENQWVNVKNHPRETGPKSPVHAHLGGVLREAEGGVPRHELLAKTNSTKVTYSD